MNEPTPQYDDEIELMDLLLVVWKWKYFIIIGAVICALAAGIISFSMWKQQPEIYRSEMVIQPGVNYIDTDGNKVYIDSSASIKALIDEGIFNDEIFNCIKGSNSKSLPASLKFKLSIPKHTNMVKISYETQIVDEGIKTLSCLTKALSNIYAEKIKYLKDECEGTIQLKESKLADLKVEEERAKRKTGDLEKKLVELDSKIEFVNNNTEQLLKQRNSLAENSTQNTSLSALLYTNIIQQNLTLEATYYNQISDSLLEKEKAKKDLCEIQKKIDAVPIEIENLEREKNNIQAIEILQPSTTSPIHAGNKTKLNVVLASVAGLFLMVFLAFFLEYISKYKSRGI